MSVLAAKLVYFVVLMVMFIAGAMVFVVSIAFLRHRRSTRMIAGLIAGMVLALLPIWLLVTGALTERGTCCRAGGDTYTRDGCFNSLTGERIDP